MKDPKTPIRVPIPKAIRTHNFRSILIRTYAEQPAIKSLTLVYVFAKLAIIPPVASGAGLKSRYLGIYS